MQPVYSLFLRGLYYVSTVRILPSLVGVGFVISQMIKPQKTSDSCILLCQIRFHLLKLFSLSCPFFHFYRHSHSPRGRQLRLLVLGQTHLELLGKLFFSPSWPWGDHKHVTEEEAGSVNVPLRTNSTVFLTSHTSHWGPATVITWMGEPQMHVISNYCIY